MSQAFIKLSGKGQIVIPRVLRDEVGVTPQLIIDRATVSAPRKSHEQSLRELAKVVAEIRHEVKEKRLDKMPKREIHAAVAAARRDLKNNGKRPGS